MIHKNFLSCFYLLIFYFEKFSTRTDVCRIIIKSHRTSRRIRPPTLSVLFNHFGYFPALPPHVTATDDRLSHGGYYEAYGPLGFRLALAPERHCSPSSNTPSQCCLIINASGFCNSYVVFLCGRVVTRYAKPPIWRTTQESGH